MAQPSANEAFFDAMVRHQIGLLNVSGSVRNDIFKLLDATEADIAGQLKLRLNDDGSITQKRLAVLLASIRAIRSEGWRESAKAWREEILAIALAEPTFVAGAITAVSPAILNLHLPAPEMLASLVKSKPFEGDTLRGWARRTATVDLNRIQDEIMIGLTQGESRREISRRIVGSAAQAGRDGITQMARKDIASVTRTAIMAMTNFAKREFYLANADLFENELYVATLDSRTTPICQDLDGDVYPVGEGPIPPVHWNCRSVRVASMNPDFVATRPMREFTNKQLLREYSAANGFKVTSRDKLPFGHKGKFDAFARKRMRELTGQVTGDVTYQTFLERQSVANQNDILGKTKGILFRKGGLTVSNYVDSTGRTLTIKELAVKERSAFIAAGLDPDKF